jgi:hypothetical protein
MTRETRSLSGRLRGLSIEKVTYEPVFRIRDPVLFTPWIRIRDEFFPDPGGKVLWWDFPKLSLESLFFYFLLIRLAPETLRSKKRFVLFFIPLFMYSRIRDENFGIRNEKFRDPDPGSGMQHCT